MVSKNYKTFGEDELDTPDQTTSRNSRRDETNRTPSSFSSRVTETDGMLEQVSFLKFYLEDLFIKSNNSLQR